MFKLSKVLKALYKIGVATAGITAFTNPYSATIAGVATVASAVSAATKDKNYKPAMTIVNLLACNIDKAANDRHKNI